ncbi:MAG: hypothetical protein RLN96_10180 [Pseudomonadales bacterium]
MSNDKIDQLFAAARHSEPYVSTDGFEEQLSGRLDQLEWPPAWLRFALPLSGAIAGMVIGILIFLGTGQTSNLSQMIQSITATSLSLPIWTVGLISLFFTAIGLLGAKEALNK